MNNPTKEIYDFLSQLYDLINETCFDNVLSRPLITIKGKRNVFGYYKPKAFVSHSGEAADELAVNPMFFASHGFKELLQTIGHEMCHQYQEHHGVKKSRSGYHNAEFKDIMLGIGLVPSVTGKEGGAMTGQSMGDYLGDNGSLVTLYNDQEAKGVFIPWYERIGGSNLAELLELADNLPEAAAMAMQDAASNDDYQTGTTRTRYAHKCGSEKASVVYGKPNLPLQCADCGEAWDEANQ